MNTQTLPDTILCPLDNLGLLEITGEDAQSFLQGQLTNDTKLITENRAQLAGYCTAKGRLLATLLLWKSVDGYCAQLHGDIAPAIQKRLGMYVLRAKVKVEDATAKWGRLGVAGQQAELALSKIFGEPPQQALETRSFDGTTLIRLHGSLPRFEIVAPVAQIPQLRAQLEVSCTPVESALWNWLEIHAGVPMIGPGTQEELVPQMANLDLLDGINFKKGCYTGQEIVARTHYLGKVKRRTHLAHADTASAPVPGDRILGEAGTEPVGIVINSAPAPGGGFDLLAEIRLESVEAGKLRLQDHETLTLLPLPYAL